MLGSFISTEVLQSYVHSRPDSGSLTTFIIFPLVYPISYLPYSPTPLTYCRPSSRFCYFISCSPQICLFHKIDTFFVLFSFSPFRHKLFFPLSSYKSLRSLLFLTPSRFPLCTQIVAQYAIIFEFSPLARIGTFCHSRLTIV